MIARLVWHVVMLLSAAAGCWWLVSQFEFLLAGLVWAALVLIACLMGGVLLYTSQVGRVTWKNRLAAYLLPWGGRICRGELWPIVAVSWVVWMLVWVAVAVLALPGTETFTTWDVTKRVLLGVAWAVDALALGSLLGTLQLSFPAGSHGGRSLRVIVAVLTTMIAFSVALHLFGLTTAGLLVAGGPTLLVGGGYGLFVLTLLIFGRNSRWN